MVVESFTVYKDFLAHHRDGDNNENLSSAYRTQVLRTLFSQLSYQHPIGLGVTIPSFQKRKLKLIVLKFTHMLSKSPGKQKSIDLNSDLPDPVVLIMSPSGTQSRMEKGWQWVTNVWQHKYIQTLEILPVRFQTITIK